MRAIYACCYGASYDATESAGYDACTKKDYEAFALLVTPGFVLVSTMRIGYEL